MWLGSERVLVKFVVIEDGNSISLLDGGTVPISLRLSLGPPAPETLRRVGVFK